MRHLLVRMAVILVTSAVFLLSSGSPPYRAEAASSGSPAMYNLETTDGSGTRIKCANVDEAKGGVLLGYIIPCLTKTIATSTGRMSQSMIDWLAPTFNAFLVFVVVMFGVRVLQGGGQVHTEGILLIMKMMLVIMFLKAIPGTFVPALYHVMDESQTVVAGALNGSGMKCDIATYQGPNTPIVWAQMDCLLGKLYGFTMGTETDSDGNKKPNMLLASSIFGLLGGFFFSGTFGAILFFACIGVLWTMFAVVLKTVSAFLNGYLYASLMFIIAPIFLPLTLLRATATYFDPWWKGILASILLPIIITSYTMFAMMMYDKMLFADDALINDLFNNPLMKTIEGVPRPVCNLQRTGNPSEHSKGTDLTDTMLAQMPTMTNFVAPFLAGSNDTCLGATKPTLDIQNLLSDTAKISVIKADGTTEMQSPRDIFGKMFQDCVKLLVLGMLVAQGLNNVVSLAGRLIGSPAVAQSLSMRGAMESKFVALQTAAKQSVTQTLSGTSGASFFTGHKDQADGLVNVPRNLAKGLTDTLGRG